jgi:hypothetical protein
VSLKSQIGSLGVIQLPKYFSPPRCESQGDDSSKNMVSSRSEIIVPQNEESKKSFFFYDKESSSSYSIENGSERYISTIIKRK